MIVFTIAITLNCVAILGLLANAIFDAMKVKHSQGLNLNANLAGLGYILTVGFSLLLFNNGNTFLATTLASFAAFPVLLLAFLLLLSSILKT